ATAVSSALSRGERARWRSKGRHSEAEGEEIPMNGCPDRAGGRRSARGRFATARAAARAPERCSKRSHPASLPPPIQKKSLLLFLLPLSAQSASSASTAI